MSAIQMSARFLLFALIVSACATTAQPADNLVPEAQRFMAAYAQDLSEGDRESIINRYDRSGVYLQGDGESELTPHARIAELYRTQWTRPAAFEWRDLAYEQTGPDAVLVTGRFRWTTAEGALLDYSYTALLRRRNELTIRLEHESTAAR